MPLFLVALIPAAFFVDGGFANLAPYTPEIFPTSLRTHGMGLAWAVSGLGRIIGPLVIALVAGTGDLVDPEATLDALAPSFLFLAAVIACWSESASCWCASNPTAATWKRSPRS